MSRELGEAMRLEGLRKENARAWAKYDALKAAAAEVVKDYPVAAGTIKCPDGTPQEELGYGSIKALRLALKE